MKKSSIKKHLIWKIILAGVFIAILSAGIPWLTYERQPLPEALASLESDSVITVVREPWLTFEPVNTGVRTGFIFYPGGRISHLGYSDFMRSIAGQGYLVVVPEMPLNIAAFAPNVADEIIASHPEITHWVIGGHSVGGTMAAQYTKTHPQSISGLVIWASYPADNANLSEMNIPVTLIYGNLDPAANDESVSARLHLLPPDAAVVRIEGGDHHQFGTYLINPEDHHATIDRAEQKEQILKATLDLLNKISGLQ